MKKTNKKEILKVATYFFIKKGHDGTSLSEIGNAVGIQKGSLFNHIKNKEELYREVVQHSILQWQDPAVKFGLKDCSLLEFIDIYTQGIKQTMKKLNELFDGNISSANYLSFILQSCEKYKDCEERISKIAKQGLEIWKSYIQKAKENGEIRQDVDVDLTGYLFHYTFYGSSYIEAIEIGLDVKQLKEIYYRLYTIH